MFYSLHILKKTLNSLETKNVKNCNIKKQNKTKKLILSEAQASDGCTVKVSESFILQTGRQVQVVIQKKQSQGVVRVERGTDRISEAGQKTISKNT